MHRKSFAPGDLVLVRNTQVEKELNRKTKPRYLGPFVVERQTKGGSYILKEMNGTLSRRGVASFRLIPYISRNDPTLQTIADTLDNDQYYEENSSGSDSDTSFLSEDK
jgi:hypothetical protein